MSGTGLRRWDRDEGLPARAGDPDRTPLGADEVLALVTAHMLPEGAPPPVEARWSYARWKPGVSLNTAWQLRTAEGVEETVVVKQHAGDKVAALAERGSDRASAADMDWPTVVGAPWADPERGVYLFAARDDTALPALHRLTDSGRIRHLMRHLQRCVPDGWEIRKRRSRFTLLRYRPERRAVVRMDLKLRSTSDDGGRDKLTLAGRALPSKRAAEVDALRRAAGDFAPGPRFEGLAEQDGLLAEEWLEVDVPGGNVFGHAEQAGAVLARLHAHPLPDGLSPRPAADPASLAPLLDWSPTLAAAADGLLVPLPPAPGPARWTHGDFHPDQVATDTRDGSTRLLDLDELRPGEPAIDIANWAADVVVVEDRPWREGVEPLLAGYRAAGGEPPTDGRLAACVAAALVQRAAAACRRLEQGAEETAARLLARAREIAAEGSAR